MEVVIAHLAALGILIAMIATGAPTWAWLAVLTAVLAGDVLGAILTR